MNQRERRDAGLAYIADNAVFEEMQKCKGILQKLNFIDRRDAYGISKLVKELLENPKVPLLIRHFSVIMAAISRSVKISLQIITVL